MAERILSKKECSVIAEARNVLSEYFEAGIILLTFQKRGRTEVTNVSFGNELLVETLVRKYHEQMSEVDSGFAVEEEEQGGTEETL